MVICGVGQKSKPDNVIVCTVRAKNYENWLAVDKVIAKTIRLTFLAHPVLLLLIPKTDTHYTIPWRIEG